MVRFATRAPAWSIRKTRWSLVFQPAETRFETTVREGSAAPPRTETAFVRTIGAEMEYSPGATWIVHGVDCATSSSEATAAAMVSLGISGVPPWFASSPVVAT